ncbi:MAG: DNA primase small subunit domain-containing protein [Nanoarchaeota archaeon]
MEEKNKQEGCIKSHKEKRIRKITQMYYSRKDIQKAIFDFSQNREISPQYFQGFGKRPDMFNFPGDIFELVKKGATSFHCSEELWEDPLKIQTGQTEEQANSIRVGWDLLIDIDCKWFDYSRLAAKSIINVLKRYKIKNIGIKFSGSKGFHILIPWKAFPKFVGKQETKNLFPEIPRIIVSFIRTEAEKEIKKLLPSDFYEQFKNTNIKRGIKCNACSEIASEYIEIELFCNRCKIGEQRKFSKDNLASEFKCPSCNKRTEVISKKEFYKCEKCKKDSNKNPENFSKYEEIDLFELMGLDLVLVSSRHLFRMPYSLHEKTALASVVLNEKEIDTFELKDANPIKVSPRNFMPNSEDEEAKELVLEALDWSKENSFSGEEEKISGKYANFKPIKLESIDEKKFPESIKKILQGMRDGRKRGLFVLINFFRGIGMDKEILEKKIYEWNEKNEIPLKKGYVQSQLSWAYRNKPVLPPNYDKDYYRGIGIIPTEEELRAKNPVSLMIRKSLRGKKRNWGQVGNKKGRKKGVKNAKKFQRKK